MLDKLPLAISLIFAFTTIATLFLFVWTVRNSCMDGNRKKAFQIFIGLTAWLIVQAVITLMHTYSEDTDSFPPKIMLFGIFPAMLLIVLMCLTSKGRQFTDRLSLSHLTYLNIVRVPVEIVLFWLFLHNTVPELMTFEGRNFDILAGISAPVIAYFGLNKTLINRKFILIWNFICLALLINIVVSAILSAPSSIQKLAFEQPNIAILYFPFSWLPTFIVPIVLYGHLASIRQLLKGKPVAEINQR